MTDRNTKENNQYNNLNEYEKENFKELSDLEKIEIKKAYINTNLNGDTIAKNLKIGHKRFRSYYKYINKTYDKKVEFVRASKKERKEIDTNEIKKDFKSGKTIEEISKKYHTRKENIVKITKNFNKEIIERHKNKIYHKSSFFGRFIENRNADIYGKIVLRSEINISGTSDRLDTINIYKKNTHQTNILTPAIKSKEDYYNFLKMIERNKYNLADGFEPYIKDFRTNREYTIYQANILFGFDDENNISDDNYE